MLKRIKEQKDIFPKKGIGNILLTDSKSDLISKLGAPSSIDVEQIDDDLEVLYYRDVGINIVLKTGSIDNIEIESESYILWTELSIGESYDEVIRQIERRGYKKYVVKKDFDHALIFCEDLGVDFEFENDILAVMYLTNMNT